MNEWAIAGIVGGLVSAAMGVATLWRVSSSDALKNKLQLAVMENIDALRKELQECYIDIPTYRADKRIARHEVAAIATKLQLHIEATK